MNSCFHFGFFPISQTNAVGISTGITGKKNLLLELAWRLQFPEYFGMNWDALDECLRDLSWLPESKAVIIHHDLPLANDSELSRIYLDILSGGISTGRLSVVFPEETKPQIETILSQ